MKVQCLCVFVLIGCVSLTGDAYGGILAYDGFDYAVGNLPNNSYAGGTGWGAAWQNVSGTCTIASGSLTPTGTGAKNLTVSGNMANVMQYRAGRYLDCSAGGVFADYLDSNGNIGKDGTTLYMSFVMQPSITDGDKEFYAFELKKDRLDDGGRVGFVGNNQGDKNSVYLYLTGGVPSNRVDVGSVTPSPALYVMRIDYKSGNDDVYVYTSPTNDMEPATAACSWTSAGNIAFDAVSFCAWTMDSSVSLNVDEIRLGTTYASVVPGVSVPEPGTCALMITGLLGLLAHAWRKRK